MTISELKRGVLITKNGRVVYKVIGQRGLQTVLILPSPLPISSRTPEPKSIRLRTVLRDYRLTTDMEPAHAHAE